MANFLVNDIERLIEAFNNLHQIVVAPVVITIYGIIIMWKFGVVGVFIDLLILALLALVYVFNKFIIKKTKARVELTDDRSSRVAEFVQKIRHIKMVGMEPYIEQEISRARESESLAISSIFIWRTIFDSLMELSPTLVVVLGLLLHYFFKSSL